jgi:hypothetical protein
MPVIMPRFLEKENLKWITEVHTPDGGTFYVAKDNAPRKIKKEVKEWNEMFERAKKNHIQL